MGPPGRLPLLPPREEPPHCVTAWSSSSGASRYVRLESLRPNILGGPAKTWCSNRQMWWGTGDPKLTLTEVEAEACGTERIAHPITSEFVGSGPARRLWRWKLCHSVFWLIVLSSNRAGTLSPSGFPKYKWIHLFVLVAVCGALTAFLRVWSVSFLSRALMGFDKLNQSKTSLGGRRPHVRVRGLGHDRR